MKITHTYEISDDLIKYVVDELNELEFDGRLTVEKIKNNRMAFEYIFRKDNLRDIEDGNIFEAWNADQFHALWDLVPA